LGHINPPVRAAILLAALPLKARSTVMRVAEARPRDAVVPWVCGRPDTLIIADQTEPRPRIDIAQREIGGAVRWRENSVPICVFGGIPFSEATSPNHWINPFLEYPLFHKDPGK
jgi:hypothetical protein